MRGMTIPTQALQGIKVLELGQLIAGPFAAKTLGDFGADVIKIEPPGVGDPLRQWRLLREGTSVWWEVQSRNKRSVCADLRQAEGQALVRQLVAEADVLVENFKPGTLEGWGLGWEVLHALNPRLVMLRMSGYGQTGPYAQKPGFGVLGEAMGGLRHLTGEPDRVPVRTGVSIGDSIAALHGVMGVMFALYHRDARGGQGQVVDVAHYESVFNLMESLLPEYDAFGVVRERAGSALPGIAPSNAYQCADGGYVLIGGNGDSQRPRTGPQQRAGKPERRAGHRHRTLDPPAHLGPGAGHPGQRGGTGWQNLHGGRYRQRPAVPGAGNGGAGDRWTRPAAQGPGRCAQTECHPRCDPVSRAGLGCRHPSGDKPRRLAFARRRGWSITNTPNTDWSME